MPDILLCTLCTFLPWYCGKASLIMACIQFVCFYTVQSTFAYIMLLEFYGLKWDNHGRYYSHFGEKGTDIQKRGYTRHAISCVEGRSLESWSSTTSLLPLVLLVVSQSVHHLPNSSLLLYRNLDTYPGTIHNQVPHKMYITPYAWISTYLHINTRLCINICTYPYTNGF